MMLIAAFKAVIDVYRGSSLVGLLDAIGQLSVSLHDKIRDEAILNELLPLLNKKWLSIEDNSNTLFPLFECFENLVSALGPSVQPFAMPIF